jgi:polyvinyl alcohol dehydrogenase (cytochrome)
LIAAFRVGRAVDILQHERANMRTARIGLFNAALGAVAFIATDAWAADWPSAGADLSNSRYQTNENKINASNVALLEVKWTFPTVGDVQAHPAVDGDYLYFPDSAGFLYKVNKKSGALIWKVKICHYTGTPSLFR